MITKSDKYADYIKDHPSYSTAEQTFYEFPNGYGASVIYGVFTYGLELSVLKWDKDGGDWERDYTTPITNDVVGHIEDLDLVLGEIYDLPEEEDLVNHPDHYNQGGIETLDIIKMSLTKEEYKGYLKGNILKYRERAQFKGNAEQDYAKARFYFDELEGLG